MSTVEHAFEWWWQRCDISEEEIKWEVFDGFKAAWEMSRKDLVIQLPKYRTPKGIEIVKAVGRYIVVQGIKVEI